VLGDRYEIFAVAQAAAMTGVPIAHISGGDVTLGAADEYYRHCITKMAALHFPSCQESAQRLIRMGEQPERVFQVGGLGDENIRNMPKLTAAELSTDLGFDLTAPFALVTFHPETGMDCADPLDQMEALLGALEDAHSETGLRYLITKSNADQGGASINAVWDEWTSTRRDWSVAVTSLGVKRYLSAMACAAAVIGNSSSGVVETPSFGVPAVNIGERQNGRPICPNVLCVPAERNQILEAIRTCLDPDFRQTASRAASPYYGPDPSGSIVRVLETWIGRPELREPKRFYDPV
jgi:GDP/UDP-N,N'-diacetylbacillosamine 2-epimerase (hydrolysing)